MKYVFESHLGLLSRTFLLPLTVYLLHPGCLWHPIARQISDRSPYRVLACECFTMSNGIESADVMKLSQRMWWDWSSSTSSRATSRGPSLFSRSVSLTSDSPITCCLNLPEQSGLSSFRRRSQRVRIRVGSLTVSLPAAEREMGVLIPFLVALQGPAFQVKRNNHFWRIKNQTNFSSDQSPLRGHGRSNRRIFAKLANRTELTTKRQILAQNDNYYDKRAP